ncbi:MAG TPA: fibronectin type III domain-containing protein, partial [Polyangia bacterium]
AATVNVASSLGPGEKLVVPHDPASSVLYQRLTDAAGTGQMPLGGPYLIASDLDDVAGWICAGAPSASNIDGGVSGDGGVVSGDVMPPTFAGASSATPGPNSVTLSWTAATDNVTPSSQIVYLVYQSTTAGGETYATPTYTTAPGVASFAIGKLAINTKYYFVVRARDAAGNVDSNTVEVNATTPAISDTQPPTFAGATSASASGNAITISWTAATDNVTASAQIVYLVYQASSPGGESYATPTYSTGPGVTSYVVAGLAPNATYYFVVRAQDQAGNVSVNTKEVSAKTSAITLSGQVQPIFTSSCATTACHSGARPAQGLDLSSGKSYGQLVNVLSNECSSTDRVAPGSAATSYLAWKIQGSGSCFFGSKMPKGATLSAADINTILGWINEGAPNN